MIQSGERLTVAGRSPSRKGWREHYKSFLHESKLGVKEG